MPEPKARAPKDPGRTPVYWLQDRGLRALIWLLMAVPYRWRVPLGGWFVAHVVGPIAGFGRRVRDNLAMIFPDMPEAEVRRLCREVPANIGRGLIEIYSGPEFVSRMAREDFTGAGVAAFEAARTAGRPIMIVTGHFGNFDAIRAAMTARGYPIGGLFRPANNGYFNDHYVRAISRIGTPVFPRGKRGMIDMVRFLRDGNILGIVIDQHMAEGARLKFFGREALTSLSAAELALKYDAILVPVYGIRRPDGLSFDLVIEAPIPPSTPEAMTQALNDSLEAQVRAHMDQWFWIHRRWKGTDTAA